MRNNIVANFIVRAWGFIAAYLFVPLYLKFLGIEAYGLVGFYSTLLVVLAFADMGFTATLNREFARLSVRQLSAGEMRDLLRTYESLYLFISVAVAAVLWILAPWFSAHWLSTTVLQPAETTASIRVLGLSIALQLPGALYLGGLMGLQQQVKASYLQIALGALRGFGAVLVLSLVSPTILAFAVWQAAASAVYCYAVRHSLWRALSSGPERRAARFTWRAVQDTWRYAAGMAGMAVLSTLLTQTDKLVVSKMLPLETFGYYSLAAALASLPILLSSAIASAVFPQLTGCVEVNDRERLVRLYHRSCELVAFATFPAGLVLAAFAGEALLAWTGSPAVAETGRGVASLLVLGQLMQAIMSVPYYLGLAHGNTRLTVQLGIWSVVFITPLLIGLINVYGVVGAGMSWLITNACLLPAYMYAVHRHFLRGELGRWWLRAVAVPLLAAAPVVLFGRWLAPHTESRILSIAQIGVVWGATMAASTAAMPEARRQFAEHRRRLVTVCKGVS